MTTLVPNLPDIVEFAMKSMVPIEATEQYSHITVVVRNEEVRIYSNNTLIRIYYADEVKLIDNTENTPNENTLH